MKRIFVLTLGLLAGSASIAAIAVPTEPIILQKWTPPHNIPQILGWMPLPACENICCGYYLDPLAPFATQALPPLATTNIQATADETQFNQTGTSVLSGKVSLTQPGRTISGDKAYLNRDPKTGQICSADLKGGVELREPGKLIVADSAHIKLGSKAGWLLHAIYRFMLGGPKPFCRSDLNNPSAPLLIHPNTQPLNAWGVASSIERKDSGIIELRHASYTTCAPTSNTWKLSAGRIDLNQESGRGYAYNTWLDVKGVPVFYTPFFSFPIDHRRESGFLFPTYGHSSRSGYSLSTPFYWNIAPNYDATLTPTYYTKRGFFGDAEFRYLTPSSNGQIHGGIIPHDAAFAAFQEQAITDYKGNPDLPRLLGDSDTRGYISWQNETVFNPHWHGGFNYNYVSDDYFIEDFNAISPTVTNQLPQNAYINYKDDIWTFIGKVQSYQTLHPVNLAAVRNPYQSLPELDLNASLPNQAYGLDYQFKNQFVYFQRGKNPGELDTPPSAQRLNLQPSVSLPLTSMAGFFTPTVLFNATAYSVGNQVAGYPSAIQRFLPTFDIDSGLYFDRDISLFNGNYQQTLEPRAYYLYTPYKNQNDIPLFDTALIPFSYDSLFLNNRFSGPDRIGDANQLTLALTTRLLDQDTGAEKFRLSVGDILFFRNRLVTACPPPGSPGAISSGTACIDPDLQVGAVPNKERQSPLAGQLSYNIFQHWTTTASGVWDQHNGQPINGNVNVQYSPEPNKILNLSYNYVRLGDPQTTTPPTPASSHQNDLNQAGISLAWPIRERWHVVGGINFDVQHGYPQTYLYGLQYDTCCWAARVVAGRTFVGLSQNNNPIFDNAVYLQWQFKGLGNIGNSDPASLLVSNIPGYQDTFDNFTIFQ